MAKTKFMHKLNEWLRRYLPAELVGTCTALLGAFAGRELSGSLAVAAIAGNVSEFVGYYGYFGVKEALEQYNRHHHHTRLLRLVLTAAKTARNLAIEFGVAELCDSLFFRPFFMYMGAQLVPNFALGIFLGKVAADVLFYSIAIVGYEVKKRWA